MAAKICVCGDINGRFREVFEKLANLNKKQNFAFMIVAGNFFRDDGNGQIEIDSEAEALIKGEIEIPFTVYVTLGRQVFPSALAEQLDIHNGELCPNVLVLGRRGFAKTTEGISIVASSGQHADSAADRPGSLFEGGYTDNDVKGSCSYNTTDILVTSDWPEGVERGCRLPCAGGMGKTQTSIAELCSALKPRYHFTTSLAFYERQPFFHEVDNNLITRFIALAPYNNKLKEKWIYAFSIDPTAEAPAQVPTGVTPTPFTPFTINNKRKLASQKDAFNEHQSLNGDDRRGRRNKRKKTGPVMPAACFFCLSNPGCAAHMIASIGEESYVAVAKGPLPKHDTYPDLGFHGHMLIIPLVHAPTIASIPGETSASATLAEMTRYKEAMQDMLASKTKNEQGRAKIGSVVWEISRAGNVHNHWQFLPVPVDLVEKGTIEAAFKAEADALDYPAFMTEDDKRMEVEQGNCFKVEIWSEDFEKKMAMPMDMSFKFDAQFGRRVLAKLLGMPGRIVWQNCPQEKSEEEADTNSFKELFKEFDFSLG